MEDGLITTKEVGNYRIKIYYDTDSACPCESWDMAACWFKIDKEIFMLPENKNKIFILGTRKTGCDLIMLGGTNCNEITMDRVFGCLGNEKFYVCQPISLYKTQQNIQERPALYVFKIATAYFREQGLVPVFEDCHCKLMKL